MQKGLKMSFRKQKQQRIAERLEKTGKADLPVNSSDDIDDEDAIERDVQSFDRHGLVQTNFRDDVKHLKKIEVIEDKIEFKRDVLVPRYIDTALAMVEAGDVSNENLLFNMAMWCLDIADIDNATTLALFVLAHQVEAPIWFKTDAATFFAGEFVEWVSPKTKKGESAEPYISQWVNAYKDLSEEQKEHLQILKHGALLVQAGKQAHLANKFDDAVALYEQADKTNPRCGVKTALKQAKEKKPLVIKSDAKPKAK